MTYLKYHLLAILVTLLVAGSFISSGKLSAVINPFSLTLLRFAIAALILLPFILFKAQYRKGILRALPRSLIISVFFAISFICIFEALKTTTPLNTGTLYTLVPFLTAIFSIFVFKEKIAKKMLLVYLIGFTGTCWVIFGGDIERLLAFSLNGGDVVFIGGCISMVCFSISMKLLYQGDEMLVIVFCTLVGGALWMLLALLIFNQPLQWHLLKSDLWLHMGYIALFATLASTFILQKTTVVLGPKKVMAYVYLSPVFVAFIMLFIEGKSIPYIVVPGMLLSLTATIVLQFQSEDNTNKNTMAGTTE